jgi:hypothetical protein
VTLPAFGATAYMPSIMLERALFVRERNDGLYRVITYLVAKIIDEVRGGGARGGGQAQAWRGGGGNSA